MKLNKYALVLFLGLGTLTSCNDNLELLNPNQQTSNTFGFNADDLEESVIAAYNHIRMEGSYARVGYTIDVCRGDEAWNSSQVWYLPFDDLNAEVTSDITWWPWREWYYTVNVCNFAISRCDEDNSQLSEKMKRIKGQVISKIRLAEQAKDSVCGQFQWIFSSHDNPGRRQPDEAYRRIDKVGPFNYKGLVTPWEEPLDVYYMYRANYVPASEDPMVYLASHTWEDRFATGRRRATIEAYSNCDSVLLYNDAVDAEYLGRKLNHGVGTHFMWENRDIRYNVLRAVGYFKGKPAAEDVLVLDGLEKAPHFEALYRGSVIVPVAADRLNGTDLLKGAEGYTYLYRLNCGGDAYTDTYGQVWAQDNSRYSHSWAESFIHPSDSVQLLSPYQASQRTTNDPIHGTRDWELFQTFRFGRHKLNFRFPVPDGEYRVELYFTEPWHGTGGGVQTDCEGLRIFDVAVNDKVLLDDLDVWAEAGHDGACKKVVNAVVKGGGLKIDFPEVKAGQALICGIAIASAASVEPVANTATVDQAR